MNIVAGVFRCGCHSQFRFVEDHEVDQAVCGLQEQESPRICAIYVNGEWLDGAKSLSESEKTEMRRNFVYQYLKFAFNNKA